MNKEMLIIGNWKMNGLLRESKDRIQEISSFLENNQVPAEIVVCPPYTLISPVLEYIKDKNISVGGQDCHSKTSGAHTGDVSASMLFDLGCKYTIVGHSERRENHGESNSLVKEKTTVAIEAGLIPVLCIGDSLEEKERGETTEVLKKQIKESLSDLSTGTNTVIAYEPIWAIGTGLVPSIEAISEITKEIRDFLSFFKGEQFASEFKILYGGSLSSSNSQDIFAIENVNGGLIGGASLKAEEFCKIINTAK